MGVKKNGKFSKDNPRPGPGRPKGSKNALRGAHGDLISAWDKVAGPETAKKLIKDALAKAAGYPVVEETFGPDGELIKRVSKHEFHFEPIVSILPYIARKMPETFEVVDITADMTPEQLRALAARYLANTDD